MNSVNKVHNNDKKLIQNLQKMLPDHFINLNYFLLKLKIYKIHGVNSKMKQNIETFRNETKLSNE